MAKKSMERKTAQQVEAGAKKASSPAKPWYQIYGLQIATFILGVAGIAYGFVATHFTSERGEAANKHRQEEIARQRGVDTLEQAEKAKYGNLYAIKDQIPEAMLNKNPQTGKYDSEILFSQMERKDNKFVLKVYMGQPPANSGFALVELPAEFKEQVKRGLEGWKDYLAVVFVDKQEDANLHIYGNDKFPDSLNAVTTLKDGYNPNLSQLKDRLYGLGNNVLINTRYADYHQADTNALANDMAHEAGHLMGLLHTDVVIEFTINQGAGFGGHTDINKVPLQTMHDFSLASPKLFPALSDKTIMMRFRQIDPHDPNKFQEPGEFDRKAVELAINKFTAKYGEKYQPPTAQPEQQTTKWRDSERASSLNDSRAR